MKDLPLFKVCEIFQSIEGEGIRSGLPCVFVRLQGCNLKCSYCDSIYACSEEYPYEYMSLAYLISKIEEYNNLHVTVTGGEPMWSPNILILIRSLVDRGIQVNIETNGSIDLTCIQQLREEKPDADIIITMDWKSMSSKMSKKMLPDNLHILTKQDVLKFVVGSVEDLDQMKKVITENEIAASVFVSPIFGEIDPKDIVNYILDNKLMNCRVQLQIHKIIWDPDTRAV